MRFIVERSNGFQVRFQGRSAVTRIFSFDEYEGRTAAMVAAMCWRDKQERTRPPRPDAAVPGHGYVRRARKLGRPVWEAFVWLRDRRCARTQNMIDVWGPRVAKRRCEEWLARHRRALGIRQGAR